MSTLTVTWTDAIHTLLAMALLAAATTAGLMLLPRARERSAWTLRITAVVELLAAAVWCRDDQHFEGRVIWSITKNHGLTQGDLVALAPTITAVILVVASVVVGRPTARD